MLLASSALLLILTGSQQDTETIRSGAPDPQLEKPCCAEPLVQLCQCLWGPVLPDLLHAMWLAPACLPTCMWFSDSNGSLYTDFLFLTPFIKASFSPHQMDKSSQSISNALLAVKVRGFICANAPVPHGGCAQGKAVLGFIWSSCAAILHHSNLHSWRSFMVLMQLLKRSVLSSPLCQAPVVFEEGRIGWRCWVLWCCWRGIR